MWLRFKTAGRHDTVCLSEVEGTHLVAGAPEHIAVEACPVCAVEVIRGEGPPHTDVVLEGSLRDHRCLSPGVRARFARGAPVGATDRERLDVHNRAYLVASLDIASTRGPSP